MAAPPPPELQHAHASTKPPSIPSISTHATSLASIITACHTRISTFLSEPHETDTLLHRVQHQTRQSLAIINDALTRYTLEQLALSYNGGKDCLVLLILFLAGLNSKLPIDEASRPLIPAMYVAEADPFSEMEEFVNWSKGVYHLDLANYTKDNETTLKSGFEDYLNKNPSIKAIFVGTRRTDPWAEKLKSFDPTDKGWPPFMRVHPVIEWRYAEIWAFLRHLGLEYCRLYDQGYTSLGGLSNTDRNPSLWDEERGVFRPAYELTDDELERSGRRP
ncbi:FAD synthase [Aspergillus undulatus]|uniref:FAD synthase n=1 Tax=Aspergillus undulatus TaxID=1810928 RepID=UPI003CCD0179